MRTKGWESNSKLIKGVGSQKCPFCKERDTKASLGVSGWMGRRSGYVEAGMGSPNTNLYTYKHTYLIPFSKPTSFYARPSCAALCLPHYHRCHCYCHPLPPPHLPHHPHHY